MWSIPGIKVRGAGRGFARVSFYPDLLPVLGPYGRARGWTFSIPPAFATAWRLRDDRGHAEETIAASPEIAPTAADGRALWSWLVPYQRRGVTRGIACGGLHLWQAPGAGKTVEQIVLALAGATPLAEGGGAIIAVTKGAVRWQYAGDVRRFTTLAPHAIGPESPPLGSYLQACAPVRRGGRLQWGSRPLLIVPWTSLVDYLDDLLQLQPEAIILDESHMGKQSRREKWSPGVTGRPEARAVRNRAWAAGQLAAACPRVYTGTGTEVFNTLPDLWGQLVYLQPKAWGRTVSRYAYRYCAAQPGAHGGLDVTGVSYARELQTRLAVVADRVSTQEAKADLPPLRRQTIYVPRLAQNRPGAFAEEFRTAGKDRTAEGTRRRLHLEVARAASCKRDFVVDRVTERLDAGQRVLLLDVWRENCTRLFAALKRAWRDAVPQDGGEDFYRQNLWLAMGGDDAHRHRVQGRVQGDGVAPIEGPCCVVGTIQALGTGLNWHRCHVEANAGLPYEVGMLRQTEDRLWRRGLDHPVEILYFVAEGTYDERVVEILLSKLPGVEAAGADADAVQQTARSLEGIAGFEDEINREILARLAAGPDPD